MLLVSSVKNRYKVPKSLLVGGQCLDRVMLCLKSFDFNDFSLKLTKYLMFPNSHFCVKIWNRASPENSTSCICNTSLPRALHNVAAVNQIVDKNPLRSVTLSLTKSIYWALNKLSQFNSIEKLFGAQWMNFIKDRANVCKICTCGDRIKGERVLFSSYTTPFNFTDP